MKPELNLVYLDDMECEAINAPSQYKHRLQHSASQCLLSVEKYQSTWCHYGWFPCCFTAKPPGGWRGEGLHRNKRWCMCVYLCVAVCVRTFECPCVGARLRVRVWEREGVQVFFFFMRTWVPHRQFRFENLDNRAIRKIWMRKMNEERCLSLKQLGSLQRQEEGTFV